MEQTDRPVYTVKNKWKPKDQTIAEYDGLILCRSCLTEKKREDFFPSCLKGHNRTCKECWTKKSQEYVYNINGLIDVIYNRHVSCAKRDDDRRRCNVTYSREEFHKWVNKQPEFFKRYRFWKDSEWVAHLRPTVCRIDITKDFSLDNLRVSIAKETKYVLPRHQQRVVEQYSVSGSLIARYDGLTYAAKVLEASAAHLCRAIKKGTVYRGYLWKYLK